MLTTNFDLNIPQARVLLVNAAVNYLAWARGTGKTTGVLGPKSADLVHKMPRGKGGFIGKDYEQILDRTLPEIMSVWDTLGYKENHHWRMGKPLPDWERPLVPPVKWDHAVSWYNGSCIMLLSLAVTGISNGLSIQWLMGDEAKYWDRGKLKEVLKAVRGLRGKFGDVAEYLSQWFATDKWADDIGDIQWFLDKKKEMDTDLVETILSLQLEVNRLKSALDCEIDPKQADVLTHNIKQYQHIADALRRKCVHFSEAGAIANELILGPEWREKQRADLPADEFAVAIDNEDPTLGRHAFYSALKPNIHYYQHTHDLDLTRPLIIAADYQASISPIVVAQYGQLESELFETLNFVRRIFALHPHGLAEACKQFAESLCGHVTKEVFYVHDHTAIGKTPLGKSFKDTVLSCLSDAGWTVTPISTGKAPEHGVKWEGIKNILNNNSSMVGLPVRINTLMAEELKISLERAKAVSMGGKVTQKDKRHENTHRYPDYPQQYATHFSDCFDQILQATHILKMVPHTAPDRWVGGPR